jgi:hypothetical protein
MAPYVLCMCSTYMQHVLPERALRPHHTGQYIVFLTFQPLPLSVSSHTTMVVFVHACAIHVPNKPLK